MADHFLQRLESQGNIKSYKLTTFSVLFLEYVAMPVAESKISSMIKCLESGVIHLRLPTAFNRISQWHLPEQKVNMSKAVRFEHVSLPI